jgi:hypothetical protein
MEIKKIYLPDDEYFPEETGKKTIVLHHTAGSHRPDWVISAWDRDKTKGGKALRVATHYVVGGKSTRDGNTDWDGVIVEAFDLKHWAHHLGTKNSNNSLLNKQSIGIEICNYGPLTKSQDGQFFNYVNSLVPEEDVVDLGKNWRGYRYYHNYTDAQIESTKHIIQKVSEKYSIDVCKGINELFEDFDDTVENLPIVEQQKFLNSKGYLGMNGKPLVEDGLPGRNTNYALRLYVDAKRGGWKPLEYQQLANEGGEGIWSHTNFRKDKFDIYPHPKLLEMLQSL